MSKEMAKDYAKKFYNSKEWQGIRASVFRRDNYLCRQCGDPAEEVHHIEHMTEANVDLAETHKSDNLVSLCRNCHCRIHDAARTGTVDDVSEEFYFDERGRLQKT